MKLTFTDKEMGYLNLHCRLMAELARRVDLESGLYRTVKKLQSKFTPSTTAAFLNGKDRRAVSEFLMLRQNQLMKENETSPEIDLIQAILEKVE
jgi:hypothetical protein